MPKGAPLVEVGYWAPLTEESVPLGRALAEAEPEQPPVQQPQPGRPDPRQHVVRGWSQQPAAQQLADYLRAGYIESYEMGYSHCRFAPASSAGSAGGGGACCAAGPWAEMGCLALTDGEFVWPEGLAHYVEAHSVRPPGEAGAALLAKATGAEGRRFAAARRAAFAGGWCAESDAGAKASALLEWDEGEGRPRAMARGMAAVVAEQSLLVRSPPVPNQSDADASGC